MKTAAQAATNYGTNGGSTNAQTNWATNFSANITSILTAAAASVGTWQTNVATALAASNFVAGLNKAKQNVAAITTKVTTVGKASFTAGVKAAAAPTGDYSLFAGKWMPAVAAEVQQLNLTNPRGDRATNRARQAAYDAWVDTQQGQYRVK